MANKDKINDLLSGVRELERSVASLDEAGIYPTPFFDRAFQLIRQIGEDLHALEKLQIDALYKRLEEHRRIMASIPAGSPTPSPDPGPSPAAPEIAPPPHAEAIPGGVSLNDALERKNLSDFRKAFSLNDRFRFRRELFDGDEEKMSRAIADLNGIHSYEESVAYLTTALNWNPEDAPVADFIKLLEKRFS